MREEVRRNARYRKSYGKLEEVGEIPNLIEIQRRSYEDFLQADVEPSKRRDVGLHKVFKSVFPISDYNGNATLEYVSYSLGTPKYDVEECKERGMTWAAPLKVTIQLVLWDINEETGAKTLSALKEDVVYFGEIPLMTEKGTFVINGTERVVVSQLHRSPGVFFDHDKGKSHHSGKLLYFARIIPYRGSWLDFEFDIKDILYVRIDRKRKLPATLILRALGMSVDEILEYYYETDMITVHKDGRVTQDFIPKHLEGLRAYKQIKDKTGRVIVKKNGRYNRAVLRRLNEANTREVEIDPKSLTGKVSAETIVEALEDVINPKTGEVLVEEGEVLIGYREIVDRVVKPLSSLTPNDQSIMLSKLNVLIGAGDPITYEKAAGKGKKKVKGNLGELLDRGINRIKVLYLDDNHIGDALWKTLMADKISSEEDGVYERLSDAPKYASLIEIYKRIRPGDPPRPETAEAAFNNLFFNPDRYDLSKVGRIKLNYKVYISRGLEAPSADLGVLAESDIKETINYLLHLKSANDPVHYTIDDIDHLGNRRVRPVGELIENQFRVGLVRLERTAKERMGMQDVDTLVPQDVVNYKSVASVMKEFFGSSQLSQFMDQTNPLSEITHKRRLSALGPGGLTRGRAGFEVRDVHPTHYGRICPIETPEGPNIGLITSLATYARVNEYGFIETPYRVVDENHRVTDEIVYMSSLEEEQEVIAPSQTKVDENGYLVEETIAARKRGQYVTVKREEVTRMDVSPKQIVSVAAALIPFLEHDDANRVLMGSNMQRQAVPCLRPSAPVIGTGLEKVVAKDSKATVTAKRSGKVVSVSANRIVCKADRVSADPLDTGVDIYNLEKFKRTNQNTCINQRPIVEPGYKIKEGEVIADGHATDTAELALGQNVVVAFMPWGGYNFEDSILINERLVKEDVFTSVHIEEFECIARDTKLGKEEITRDIPNVGEEALKNLDESGIVRIGAVVKQGDIIVGKVTPKGDSQLSPEEKLLRAIFGEKAGEVRDTSLRLPPGVEGTVIDAQVFTRKGAEKDERTLMLEKREIERIEKDQRDEIKILIETAMKEICALLVGKETTAKLLGERRKELIQKGVRLTEDILRDIPFEYLRDIQVGDEKIQDKVNNIVVKTGQLINNKKALLKEKIARIKQGDDLAPGVIKMVRVFVAIKRKIQVGDKLAGRHGNKGVLSRVVPEEDMPYLEDGTTVDIVLNPLGVPSRMNVGQILETHLGLACWMAGKKAYEMAREVIDIKTGKPRRGVSQEQVSARLKEVREFLAGAYNDPEISNSILSLSDKGTCALVEQYKEGIRVSCPVFDSASEEEIRELLRYVGMPEDGKLTLYDGRTGEPFAERVTVGVMYMLKLDHLVDDKIHARSIGPYSLVTQQPLGGKAQFGGQRLGEMEVWALEAYGAAYALQEFLTVKSDDVQGRTRMYEAIVKGEHVLEPGIPESFNVMMKELMALGINVELIEDKEDEGDDDVMKTVRLGAISQN